MGTEEHLTEYEKRRAEIIARNKARLQELGLVEAFQEFSKTFARPKKPAKERKPKVKQEPSRKSTRLQGADAETAVATEIALFVINDECPRCGKVLTRGHKRHLAHCTAISQPQTGDEEGEEDDDEDEEEDEDEEQVAQEQGVKARRDAAKPRRDKGAAAKLKELELSGLIEFTPERAVFAIIGSTGSTYKIQFATEAGNGFGEGNSSCQCMDYRLRRHSCKHIRLVLKELGIEKDPSNWHKAIEGHLDSLQQRPMTTAAQAINVAVQGTREKQGSKAGKQQGTRCKEDPAETRQPPKQMSTPHNKRRKLPASLA